MGGQQYLLLCSLYFSANIRQFLYAKAPREENRSATLNYGWLLRASGEEKQSSNTKQCHGRLNHVTLSETTSLRQSDEVRGLLNLIIRLYSGN